MRSGKVAAPVRVRFSLLVVLAVLWSFSARPALAGLQVASGEMASCAGGGFSADLVATGTVEDVVASQTSSRVEVRVEDVLLGDRDYTGKTLSIETDSGINRGNTSEVSFQDDARYELYLQGDDDGWKTNICLGTRRLTEPAGNLEGAPEAASSPDSPTIPETGGPGLTTLAAVGGLVLAGIGAACGWRGRRRG